VRGTPVSSLQTFSYALPEVSTLKASPLGNDSAQHLPRGNQLVIRKAGNPINQ
jgi:hypothetical protein